MSADENGRHPDGCDSVEPDQAESDPVVRDLARLAAYKTALLNAARQRPPHEPERILTGVDKRARVLVPHPFGSPEWAQFVFTAEPSQDRFKTSRPAERGVVRIAGVTHWTEGHERIALYVLEHLQLGGLIRRIKSQPFSWLLPGSNRPRTPDFLVELRDGRLLIIEVKAHRYIDVETQTRFDTARKHAASAGVDLLVWTDRTFLTRTTRNLFSALRLTRAIDFDPGEIDSVIAVLQAAGGKATLGQLFDEGLEPALVQRAIRDGRVYISLYEDLDVTTNVSLEPVTDLHRFLFDRGYHTSDWWRAMQNRRLGT